MIGWRKSPIHAQWCASRAADFYCRIQLKVKLNSLIQLNNPLSLINFSAGLRSPTGKDSQEFSKMTELPILPLVDPFWPSTHLRDPRIIVLDATFPLSGAESTGIASRALHIPGARWLDFRHVSRKRHPVPRWISSAAEVARAMSDLRVHHEMHVVIYDQHGLSMGASRAWWLFDLFGHDRVSVLDGGLTAWLAADLPVESGAAAETTSRPRIEELPSPSEIDAAPHPPTSGNSIAPWYCTGH